MNKWATKIDIHRARVATNFVFARFGNHMGNVAKAACVSRETAKKWYKQGFISQTSVQKLLDSPEVNNAIKKKDCRPDIESWN